MDTKELLKIAAWAKVREEDLKDLHEQYKADTGDEKTPFVEFCIAMYNNCKH